MRGDYFSNKFDFALWMDSDNIIAEDTCEDMLGNLVALRHGWSYNGGKFGVPAAMYSSPIF